MSIQTLINYIKKTHKEKEIGEYQKRTSLRSNEYADFFEVEIRKFVNSEKSMIKEIHLELNQISILCVAAEPEEVVFAHRLLSPYSENQYNRFIEVMEERGYKNARIDNISITNHYRFRFFHDLQM